MALFSSSRCLCDRTIFILSRIHLVLNSIDRVQGPNLFEEFHMFRSTKVKGNTVQCGTVQYNTVQYSTVQYGASEAPSLSVVSLIRNVWVRSHLQSAGNINQF